MIHTQTSQFHAQISYLMGEWCDVSPNTIEYQPVKCSMIINAATAYTHLKLDSPSFSISTKSFTMGPAPSIQARCAVSDDPTNIRGKLFGMTGSAFEILMAWKEWPFSLHHEYHHEMGNRKLPIIKMTDPNPSILNLVSCVISNLPLSKEYSILDLEVLDNDFYEMCHLFHLNLSHLNKWST